MKKGLLKKLGLVLTTAAIAVTTVVGLTACNGQDGPYVEDDIKVIPAELTNEQYAFGMKKTNTALVGQINQIMKDKATEISAIMDKYLNATAEQLDSFGYDDIATVPSTDAAQLDKEFVVHTNIDFKPFEYYNGTKIAGIDIEIAKLFAQELNQKLVVVHNPNFDAVVTSVQENPVYDIAMAGLTVNEERKEALEFSDPYYDSTQVVVVKKDSTLFDECVIKNADGSVDKAKSTEKMIAKLSTLTGAQSKCGGQKGTSSYFYIAGNEGLGYDGYANLTFKPYFGAGNAVTDMLNGNIEFVVVDIATANALEKTFNNN